MLLCTVYVCTVHTTREKFWLITPQSQAERQQYFFAVTLSKLYRIMRLLGLHGGLNISISCVLKWLAISCKACKKGEKQHLKSHNNVFLDLFKQLFSFFPYIQQRKLFSHIYKAFCVARYYAGVLACLLHKNFHNFQMNEQKLGKGMEVAAKEFAICASLESKWPWEIGSKKAVRVEIKGFSTTLIFLRKKNQRKQSSSCTKLCIFSCLTNIKTVQSTQRLKVASTKPFNWRTNLEKFLFEGAFRHN